MRRFRCCRNGRRLTSLRTTQFSCDLANNHGEGLFISLSFVVDGEDNLLGGLVSEKARATPFVGCCLFLLSFSADNEIQQFSGAKGLIYLYFTH